MAKRLVVSFALVAALVLAASPACGARSLESAVAAQSQGSSFFAALSNLVARVQQTLQLPPASDAAASVSGDEPSPEDVTPESALHDPAELASSADVIISSTGYNGNRADMGESSSVEGEAKVPSKLAAAVFSEEGEDNKDDELAAAKVRGSVAVAAAATDEVKYNDAEERAAAHMRGEVAAAMNEDAISVGDGAVVFVPSLFSESTSASEDDDAGSADADDTSSESTSALEDNFAGSADAAATSSESMSAFEDNFAGSAKAEATVSASGTGVEDGEALQAHAAGATLAEVAVARSSLEKNLEASSSDNFAGAANAQDPVGSGDVAQETSQETVQDVMEDNSAGAAGAAAVAQDGPQETVVEATEDNTAAAGDPSASVALASEIAAAIQDDAVSIAEGAVTVHMSISVSNTDTTDNIASAAVAVADAGIFGEAEPAVSVDNSVGATTSGEAEPAASVDNYAGASADTVKVHTQDLAQALAHAIADEEDTAAVIVNVDSTEQQVSDDDNVVAVEATEQQAGNDNNVARVAVPEDKDEADDEDEDEDADAAAAAALAKAATDDNFASAAGHIAVVAGNQADESKDTAAFDETAHVGEHLVAVF